MAALRFSRRAEMHWASLLPAAPAGFAGFRRRRGGHGGVAGVPAQPAHPTVARGADGSAALHASAQDLGREHAPRMHGRAKTVPACTIGALLSVLRASSAPIPAASSCCCSCGCWATTPYMPRPRPSCCTPQPTSSSVATTGGTKAATGSSRTGRSVNRWICRQPLHLARRLRRVRDQPHWRLCIRAVLPAGRG